VPTPPCLASQGVFLTTEISKSSTYFRC